MAEQSLTWQQLTKGIDYTQIPVKQAFADGKIHAFRIDHHQHPISVALANKHAETSLYIKRFAELTNAQIAINGGFFDPDKKPLGLRINQYQTEHPLRTISWWGVFYIANNRANIVSANQFRASTRIQMALQAGPRIIINGTIPPLRGGEHQRSAICLNSNREVIFVITEYTAMSTTALAKAILPPMAQGGLGCVNALNLDGGSSSQLYADIGEFNLYISNLSTVSDALVVN